LLSVDGTEDLAPRYLSSNEVKEAAAFVSDVAALLALVEAFDSLVDALLALVLASPAFVVAVLEAVSAEFL